MVVLLRLLVLHQLLLLVVLRGEKEGRGCSVASAVGEVSLWVTDLFTVRNANRQMHIVWVVSVGNILRNVWLRTKII